MEDKRTILAVILSIAFIVLYSQTVMEPYLQQHRPAPPPPQAVQQKVSQNIAPNAPAVNVPGALPENKSTATLPAFTEYSASPKLTVETPLVKAVISSLGGRILEYRLKNYSRDLVSPDPVDLVSRSDLSPPPLGLIVGEINDATVKYSLGDGFTSDRSVRLDQSQEAKIDLVGTLSDGTKVTKSVTIRANSYLLDVNLKLESGPSAQGAAWLEWAHHFTAEQAHTRRHPVGFKTLSSEQKLNTIIVDDSTPNGLSPVETMRWISYEDSYFVSTLIPTLVTTNAQTGLQRFQDRSETLYLRALAGSGSGLVHIFAGPKDDHILEATGFNLERNIDLGIFSFLAFPLLWLMRFFNSFLGNWGLSIIVLTLFIKAVFLPLTKASFKSMQAMQELQPEIKALRERISDPNQLNQEMLGLYKRRGVNPMGGCFPILIQIPVFIGLYNALLNAFELRHAKFALWVNDLSAPEALHVFGLPIPVMVLILGASMFIQQYQMPNTMDPVQRKVMYLMPVILTASFLVYPLPAGLVLYWLVNNTISIVQQSYIKNTRKAGPFGATALAGSAIFAFGYVLTLL